MLQLKNQTPFKANIAVFPNEQGIDTLYVVVKATFALKSKPAVAEEQQLVVLVDEYWGEPGKSSLKYPSEAHLAKPSTDILFVGEACAPDQRPVKQLDVTVAVGDRRKAIRVYGDRHWEKGWIGIGMSAPAPFQRMPMQYERAFGGMHQVNPKQNGTLFEPRNPVGQGFIGKRSKKEANGTLLPNLEDPGQLIKRPTDCPRPAGVGAVSPSWEPRKSFAGTYDAAWRKSRAPYLPDDFNSRFFNMAHADLICSSYLTGGEPIELVNVSAIGPIRCAVPTCRIDAAVRIAGRIEKPTLNLETLLLEPPQERLCLTWRASVPCDKKALKVEQVDILLHRLDLQ